LKLDPIDLTILRELSLDGRASFREIARRTTLSTPTVSSRFERMVHAGLIQKFVPVFDLETSEVSGMTALVSINVPISKIEKTSKVLARMPEVIGVYLTGVVGNILLKIGVPNMRALQRFITGQELQKLDAKVEDSKIITKIVKDEQSFPFVENYQMNLKCDLCKGEIANPKPYTIKLGAVRYYFCCKTCKAAYLEKHGSRIRALSKNSVEIEG
jgi:DNA-binding Lrp family transcriptional regulator